jgi:hypothetical protein
MGLRLQTIEWNKQFRKLIKHPVTGFLALTALGIVTLVTLVTVEARLIRSPHTPVIFSPK